MTKTAPDSSQTSTEVPLFLRKTFHMVDTCDPKIASWSEDGKTFVVKDPNKFERTIIPQFFKHNKFTSFVRQLNFYQFRKVKYTDSIRIDPKLEAETANYWRFHHDFFQRGRPDLLLEIKRANGAKGGVVNTSAATTTDDKGVKTEVQTLKKRIEEMTKNIDQLTAMVNKVSLKQEEITPEDQVGEKRKKLDPLEENLPPFDAVRPDEMFSNMELESDIALLPGVASLPLPDGIKSTPAATGLTRETSVASRVSDNEFVDELFSAFAGEELPDPEPISMNMNQPDSELMKRLGDALVLLPHETQVMIVDRLVAAITGTEIPTPEVKPSQPVPPSPDVEKTPTPLAAATLAALLHHYSAQVQGKSPKSVPTIPVIPVHA